MAIREKINLYNLIRSYTAIYDLMSIFPREEADKRLLSNALTLREKKERAVAYSTITEIE